MNINRVVELADLAFESYSFGDGLTVARFCEWDQSAPRDLVRLVHLEAQDGRSDDVQRVSFHVRFDEQGCVSDAYALSMLSGADIGARGHGPACAETLQALFGGYWGSHTEFSHDDWAAEAADNNTRLGYWDWVASMVESASDDDRFEEAA